MLNIIAGFLGRISAYFLMSIMGIVSLFSPTLMDGMLESLIKWSEKE